MYEEKVKVIRDWLTPKSIKTFHGLTSFYTHFMKDFSTLVTPLNEVVQMSVGFKWWKEQEWAFVLLKEKLCSTLVLALPNFTKTFEIEYDTFRIRISVVLTQDWRPIAYFNKLSGTTFELSHL